MRSAHCAEYALDAASHRVASDEHRSERTAHPHHGAVTNNYTGSAVADGACPD